MRDVKNGDRFKKYKRRTLNGRNVLRPSAFPFELRFMTLDLLFLSALFPVWVEAEGRKDLALTKYLVLTRVGQLSYI